MAKQTRGRTRERAPQHRVAKKKAIRQAKKKALQQQVDVNAHTDADETLDTLSPRALRSRKLMVDKQPDHPHLNPQPNDAGGNATDEDKGTSVIQSHHGSDKLEDVDHSIERTADQDEAGMPRVEMKGRPRRDRKHKGKEVIGKADQAKVEKGKVFHHKLDAYLLPFTAKQAAAKPVTQGKPRAPPWNKGLKMKKVARKPPWNKGLKMNKTPVEETPERVDDETMADWNEEASQNIEDNTTNLGELNTELPGPADDEETGVYNDRASRDAGDEVRTIEMNTDTAGVADEDTRLYHHGSFCNPGDEDKVGERNIDPVGHSDDEQIGVDTDRASREPNTDTAGVADDEDRVYHHDAAGDENIVGDPNTDASDVVFHDDVRMYHHQVYRDADDEGNVGGLGTGAVGLSDDEEIRVYNGRASRELNTDAAGVVDDKEPRVYHQGAFHEADDEDRFGEPDTDAAGLADDEDTRLYSQGSFRDADDEDSVGEPNTGAAGVADDEDTGMYHQEADDEDSVGEPNTGAAGVADDEDTGEYHQEADDEYSVGELNAGAAGDEDNGPCHQGASHDAGDDGYVGEPNTNTPGVAGDEDTGVYHQQAVRDARPQHNSGELGSDVSGFDGDAVRIHNSQAFHNPSDEVMGDAPNTAVESFRDDSSDLTSYKTDSHSPNIIAKAKDGSEVSAGMDLPDHAMGDVKDVIMGEAGNRAEDRTEDGPSETAQRI